MVMYAGLVLLFCLLGIAAGGEEPMGPNQFQAQPQWSHQGHLTTVCIQVRGPHGPELCGPVVPQPDSKDHPELFATRNSDTAVSPGLVQQDQFRGAQGENWVGQSNPTPLRSAAFQGFIGNGPVYQMEPGRAVDTLPPLVRVNAYPPPPSVSMVRAPEQPCLEHGMRLAGPPPQVMMAPSSEMAPTPVRFMSPAPQLRTFPFAPFGVEQSSGPPQQFQMRQALGARASNSQFVPAFRSADCLDNTQQPGGERASMRAGSYSFNLTPQDVKILVKQCEQNEQEINKKKEEISELRKQIDRMSESAKASSSTTVEQKSVTAKSSQGQSTGKEVKNMDKELNDNVKSTLDSSERKKRK